MKPRALVIDPLHEVAESLVALLVERGWEARSARSLSEAFRTTDSFEPHLVLAGVESPLEVGVAFGRRLRELHDGAIVLAAMSGWPPADVKEQEPQLFDVICHKPMTNEGFDRIESRIRERFPDLVMAGSGASEGTQPETAPSRD